MNTATRKDRKHTQISKGQNRNFPSNNLFRHMKDMLCQSFRSLSNTHHFSLSTLNLPISQFFLPQKPNFILISSLGKMQDVHGYSGGGGGGGGMFFSEGIGGGGGGDRRMRAQQNNVLNHHQSLKCPRCNSLNTKFCYYNNYNLSQPRYFCKNCRRYWTKGGVLRNVPVGGGCRKAKRSKSKQSSSAEKSTTQDVVEKKASSSESSSLTASNSTVAAVTVTAVAETAKIASSDMPNLKLYGNGIEWSTLLGQGSSDGGVFSEIGGFTSPFRFGGNSVNQQCIDDHLKLESEAEQQKFGDRTVQDEFPGRSSDPNMGFEPLDWGCGGGDQTLFDLTSTVDHAYWSQSQWTTTPSDQDHNGLYLP